MFNTHELPSSKSGGSLVESPRSSENTELSTGTKQFNLNIAPSLMIDPNSRSHVLKPFDIGFIQHFRCDFVRRLDPVGRNVCTSTSDDGVV
jgi:hypothetical protein